MATKAKRKKPGRPKAIAGAKKSLPQSKKFGGKVYKKAACSRLKSGATKTAKAARAKGKAARVVKNPAGGFCVFTRGAARA